MSARAWGLPFDFARVVRRSGLPAILFACRSSTDLSRGITRTSWFFIPVGWGWLLQPRHNFAVLFWEYACCRGLQGLTQLITLKVPQNFVFKPFLRVCSAGGVLEEVAHKEMGRVHNSLEDFQPRRHGWR